MPRKIAVVTGSRAEYGLLYWLLREIQDDPDLQLQLIVTGAHLSPEFGLTVQEIEADGFPIAWRVEMLLSSDTAVAVAKSTGLGTIGFADALAYLKPDLIVVLGDRFEILAAATAALLVNTPIAHIHGGEITLGAYDDAIRHAVTKMSTLHFVAHDNYRNRVLQMGENPQSVFNVGPACLDALIHIELPPRKEIEALMEIAIKPPLFVVTYHPETRSSLTSAAQVEQLLIALNYFATATIICTGANADNDGRIINEWLSRFCANQPQKRVFRLSLGRQRYWGILALADVVIGNSSSGIVEAPLLGVPVVNIGDRQAGRLRDRLIQDCPCEAETIAHSIRQALVMPRSQRDKPDISASPAKQMVAQIKKAPLRIAKHFHDIDMSIAV